MLLVDALDDARCADRARPAVSIVPPSQGSSSTSGASQRESSLGSVSQRQVSSRSAGSTISRVTLAMPTHLHLRYTQLYRLH